MFMNNRKCGCEMSNMYEPIMEAPIEKCIQKNIVHEVEHICPINTKIINNHIYKHVYKPQYSCTEEDVVTNIDDCCGQSNFDF